MCLLSDEIGETLETLMEQVKKNLHGGAAIFFDREFSFFKEITDISRLIKPFPKGEAFLSRLIKPFPKGETFLSRLIKPFPKSELSSRVSLKCS